MRKKLLLTAFMLTGMAFAIMAQNSRPMTEIISVKKVTEKPTLVNSVSAPMEFKNAVISVGNMPNWLQKSTLTRADDVADAFYKAPIGSLFEGIFPDGWYSTTSLATPVDCKPTFFNYSTKGAKYKWSISDGETTKPLEDVDATGNMTCTPVWGTVYTPTLEVTSGTAKASYQLGAGSKGKTGFWIGGTDVTSLSYADPAEGQVYGGFSDLAFSTGKIFKDTKKKVTGFCTFFDKPLGSLFARSMYMIVTPTIENGVPMTEDVELTLNLHKLTAEGEIGEKVGTATATTVNMAQISNGDSYYIRFLFSEEDEFGFPVNKALNLGDSPLVALFTGFENASFDMLFANAMGFPGNSFVILEDGTLATVGYSNAPESPQINFHIGFEGAFPYAKIVEETSIATIPNAGGYGVTNVENGVEYNDIVLRSSITVNDAYNNDNYTIVSIPDWIEGIEIDDTNIKSGLMLFFVKGQALPSNMTGRSGKIEIDVCGTPATINVVQGDGTVGIANTQTPTVKAVYDGKNIQLTYPEQVTAVSVVNIAGQVLRTYELPSNGLFIVPEVDFGKGMYLLKFNNNQTIKVIK